MGTEITIHAHRHRCAAILRPMVRSAKERGTPQRAVSGHAPEHPVGSAKASVGYFSRNVGYFSQMSVTLIKMSVTLVKCRLF